MAGLSKLVEASESVAQLSKDLVVKEKELAVASVRADKVRGSLTPGQFSWLRPHNINAVLPTSSYTCMCYY